MLQVAIILLGKVEILIASNHFKNKEKTGTGEQRPDSPVKIPAGTPYEDFLPTDYRPREMGEVFEWGHEMGLAVGGTLLILIPTIAFVDLSAFTKGLVLAVSIAIVIGVILWVVWLGPSRYGEILPRCIPIGPISVIILVLNGAMIALAATGLLQPIPAAPPSVS